MKQLLNFLKPKPQSPTIESYGQQDCGVAQEQIQSVMEWLFASLMNAGYYGKSHVIWYNDAKPDSDSGRSLFVAMRQGKPVFLYGCGSRVQPPPDGYRWRMMVEHPSMRVYQLEV